MTPGKRIPPTRDELLETVADLAPLLGEFACYGEENRTVADAVIDGLTEAGLFRLLKPSRFGGYQLDMGTLVHVTEALGAVDASAAWLVGIAATSALIIGTHGSALAQDEVFGADPDARIAGVGDLLGIGHRVDGGLKISGTWPYASGSAHATWFGLSANAAAEPGQHGDGYMCLLPATDVRIEDTWHTIGMRATGSNSLLAENAFVPEHRLISIERAFGEHGPRVDVEPLCRIPFSIAASLGLTGPLLGATSAALDIVIQNAPSKPLHHTTYSPKSDSVGVQMQIARAALKLQTARLHVHSVADEVTRRALSDRPSDYPYRARARAEISYAVEQLLDAMQILLNVQGAGAFAETNALQRYFRDVNTGARHAGLIPAVGYEIFGKMLVGSSERISPMV
jgi:3-hydroxy-9,10-secoandrosta-1,3,5(10)-triene-9,17-dione monooxygenase